MKPSNLKFTRQWQTSLSDYVTALAWSPDGSAIAAASAAGEVLLHRWSEASDNGTVLHPADGQAVSVLGFSADGQYLAAAGQSGQVWIWALRSPSVAPVLTQSHPGMWLDQLVWHPTEPWLAYGVASQVQVWDIAEQKQIAELAFENSSALHLAWQPNGKTLAVSGHGGIKVWQQDDWTAAPKLIAVPGASLYVAWSDDGRYLSSGNLDRTLTVAEWESPPPWLMQGFPGKVRQLSWSVSQRDNARSPLLAAACAEGITVWERQGNSWKSQVLQHHKDTVEAIAFRPHSELLASGSKDGTIGIWQQGKKLVHVLKDASNGVSCLTWHPDGGSLAAASMTGDVMVWQLSQVQTAKGFGS